MPDGQYWFVKSCDFSKWLSVENLSSVSFETRRIAIKLNVSMPNLYWSVSYLSALYCSGRHWSSATVQGRQIQDREESRVTKHDLALGEFLAAYHDTPSTASGNSQNFLMFSRTGLSLTKRGEDLDLQAAYHKDTSQTLQRTNESKIRRIN